jgi:iron(II)-dependent oxidoreductase
MAQTPRPLPASAAATPHSIDSPDMCRAGRDMLSLALIDARNHTLHLLSLFEQALGQSMQVTPMPEVVPPVWLAGHIGWFAEWWIGRNTQRAFGNACPTRPTRLASIDPGADDWWSPLQMPLAQRDPRGLPDLPDLMQTKAYLLDTLESTLELLEHAAETDDGLYFFRLALFHEDLRGEQFAGDGADAGPADGRGAGAGGGHARTAAAAGHALDAGHEETGFAFAQERGTHRVDVPEFEIDAQPVTWDQYVEFVDDGGYDREELWHGEGWRWLAAQIEGRRGPRHVEQIGVGRHGAGGSVLQQRFGATVRAAGHHSAVHLSWWEADAWARWAGRRIATEVEWEIAAHRRRGAASAGPTCTSGRPARCSPGPATRPTRGARAASSIRRRPSARRACCAAPRSPRGRGCVRHGDAASRCPSATTASSASGPARSSVHRWPPWPP